MATSRNRPAEKKGTKQLTRQRKWQLKMASLNRCQICGKPTSHYKTYCDAHAMWKRKLRRRASNSKPWKPGAKGRPPLM